MNSIAWIPLSLVLVLAGCGGGDSSSTPSTTTTTTASFDLATGYDQVFSGSTFNLTGTDNNGSSYTASITFANRGTTTVNGQTVTQVDDIETITNTTTSASATGTTTRYYLTNWTPFQIVFNTTGVTYTPATLMAPPASAVIGDFGNLPTFTGSDGSQMAGSWQLSAGTSGNAILTFDYITTNGGTFQYEEADSFTVSETGNVSSLKVVIHYANGTVVTLSGPKQ